MERDFFLLDSCGVFLGHPKYLGNPQHPKALVTQARAFGPLGGATAALTCKYVTNAFGCGDCLLLPIIPVERGDSLLPASEKACLSRKLCKADIYQRGRKAGDLSDK